MKPRLLILCLLIAPVCTAMELVVRLETLVQESDRIVRGKVISLAYRAGTNEYGDELIYTDVSIRVAEALKGDRSDLLLTVEGGTLNRLSLVLSDSPEFQVGEEVLVFAKKELLTYVPFAHLQSKYTISKDGIVVEKGMYFRNFKKQILEAINKKGYSREDQMLDSDQSPYLTDSFDFALLGYLYFCQPSPQTNEFRFSYQRNPVSLINTKQNVFMLSWRIIYK